MKKSVSMYVTMNLSQEILQKYTPKNRRFYPIKMVFYKPLHKVFTSNILNRYVHKKENFNFVSNVVIKNLELLKVEKKLIQNNLIQYTHKKLLQKLSNNLATMIFTKTYITNRSKKDIAQVENNINKQDFYQGVIQNIEHNNNQNVYEDSMSKQYFLHNFFNFQKSYISQMTLSDKQEFTKKMQQNNYSYKDNINILNNFFDLEKLYLSPIMQNKQIKLISKMQQNLLTSKLKNYQKNTVQNINIANQIKKFKKSEAIYLQPRQTDQKIYRQSESKFYFNKEQHSEDSITQIKETIIELKKKVINKELEKQPVEKEHKNQDIDINHLTNQVYQNIERKIRFERERKGF